MRNIDINKQVEEFLFEKFRFCFLKNVVLYKTNRSENDLFANEIDFLVHFKSKQRDKLIIIETKNQTLQVNQYRGRSQWIARYGATEKEVQKQVWNQMEALQQFCANLSENAPKIEAWIVDQGDRKNPSLGLPALGKSGIFLLTYSEFIEKLHGLKKIELEKVEKVKNSLFLNEIRKGIPSPDIGHPEIPNAVDFINKCRKNLDGSIYRFFKPSKDYFAINGCAGMGKTVLLSYALYVFSSDYHLKDDGKTVELFQKKSDQIGLPPFSNRRIYAFSVKLKQVKSLTAYWDQIKAFIENRLDIRTERHQPKFDSWKGDIPEDCNILVIDEAHDLSNKDQLMISQWVADKSNGNRYLLIACDRNQALRKENEEERIISGLNFKGRSKRLMRIYRCPFPVYMASLGLLFRWFADSGPKIMLSNENLRASFGFKAKIEENNQFIKLSMRNDCHPGNNWNETVAFFENCENAYHYLSQFSLKPETLLWARFEKTDSDFDYQKINKFYTLIDLSGPDVEDEIDQQVKGQEFSIVIVEGLPANINPTFNNPTKQATDISTEEKLIWKSRRYLYLVCSRAKGFLFFIPSSDDKKAEDVQELRNLYSQLSTPEKGAHESGQTWKVMIQRPAHNYQRNPMVFREIENDGENANGPESIEVVPPSTPPPERGTPNTDGARKILSIGKNDFNYATLSSLFRLQVSELQRLFQAHGKPNSKGTILLTKTNISKIANQLGFEVRFDDGIENAPSKPKHPEPILGRENPPPPNSTTRTNNPDKPSPSPIIPANQTPNFEIISPDSMPKALLHVLEVIQRIKRHHESRIDATRRVSNQYEVEYNTVADKYGRRLGLTSSEFDELVAKEDLREIKNKLLSKYHSNSRQIDHFFS